MAVSNALSKAVAVALIVCALCLLTLSGEPTPPSVDLEHHPMSHR